MAWPSHGKAAKQHHARRRATSARGARPSWCEVCSGARRRDRGRLATRARAPMSWASASIALLCAGRRVQVRPRGNSMRPRIESGALCTLEPLGDDVELEANDIVLCSVRGTHYLHLIKAVQGGRYLIGN